MQHTLTRLWRNRLLLRSLLLGVLICCLFSVSLAKPAHAANRAANDGTGIKLPVTANGTTGVLNITSSQQDSRSGPNHYGLTELTEFGTLFGDPVLIHLVPEDSSGLVYSVSMLRADTSNFEYFQLYSGTLYNLENYQVKMSGTFKVYHRRTNATYYVDAQSYSWSTQTASDAGNAGTFTDLTNNDLLTENIRANGTSSQWKVTGSFDSYLTGRMFGNGGLGDSFLGMKRSYSDGTLITFVRLDSADFSYFQIYAGSIDSNNAAYGTFFELNGSGSFGGPYEWSMVPAA